MKILFIQQDVFQRYGTMMLSAICKRAGHSVDILIDSIERDLAHKAKELDPDIVCFSLVSTHYPWFRETAQRIKKRVNKPVIVGGPHPTFFPEIIEEEYIDVICRGEGEGAFTEFVTAISEQSDTGSIKNLWIKRGSTVLKNETRDLIDDLDSLPFADRELYMKYRLFRYQNKGDFTATRGCPYDCTFCFNKKYNELYLGKGRVVRRRSARNLADEIIGTIMNNKRISYVQFNDDSFTLGPHRWFEEFFTYYANEISLPFSVNTRADLIDEGSIIRLKKAGCNSVRMGIESAVPELRERVLRKGITNAQISEASRLIKKHGLALQVYNILGIPGETLETACRTYELSKRIHPVHAWCSLMQPYPGTEIAGIAKEKGLLPQDFDYTKLDNSYFNSIPMKIEHKKELENLQKLFQFGNLARIPVWLMKILIGFPENAIFDLVFKICFALGIMIMDKLSIRYVIGVALHSRGFIRRKRGTR